MKNRKLLLAVFVIGVLVFIYISVRRERPNRADVRINRPTPEDRYREINKTTKEKPIAIRAKTNEENVVSRPPAVRPKVTWRDAAKEQNVPINFWGKVMDQNDHPLAGVKISAKARQWGLHSTSPYEITHRTHDLTTDSTGQFEIKNERGDLLTITALKKEGYELSHRAEKSFGYNISKNTSPDPNNPIVFKMWKKRKAEPLVLGEKFFGIIPDGRVYTLDFLNGKKIEGENATGDIRIKIQRPVPIQPHTKFAWSFVIEGIEGGIIETDDEFMNLAPEAGYVKHYEVQLDPADPKWKSLVKKQFFIRSRGGEVFGRMKVEIISDYNEKSIFNVEYAVNPAGSRNLEYDPTVQPKSPVVFE